MQTKLERLLRYHRQNVFHDDDATADRHSRALRRLQASATFKAMCEADRQARALRFSDRLLSLYA